MASTAISAAQAEIINSLTQDEIPAKLRCAMCSKLAVNAFRLPCCEQAICEKCQSTLPSSCPVCEHSPLSADDCTPHKSLRTTIKVFLRTEEKKRESSRPKEPTPATPVQADHTPQLPTPNTEAPAASAENAVESSKTDEKTETSAAPEGEHHSAGGDLSAKDHPASTEPEDHKPTDGTAEPSTANAADGQGAPKEDSGEQADGETSGGNKEGDEDVEDIEGDQQNQVIAGAGVNSVNGSFPNANMNFGAGNFDQMQMMMAMQNGMAPNAFGAFPMMGMPGMTMDPMAMQNMYMNGGFGAQGMGMNGMNMNMGIGGFGGGGPNNNWNNGGQQSWNVGPDNLNYPNASGMGNGDYGSFNTGFQTGYNQGNYGHGNQFNNYRGNQYGGFRGRGRGRGAYGQFGYQRGGYNQAGGYGHSGYQEQPNHMAQQQYQQPGTNEQGLVNGSGATEEGTNSGETKPEGVAVDEFGRELRIQETTEGGEGGVADQTDASKSAQQEDGSDGKPLNEIPSYVAPEENGEGHSHNGPNAENQASYDDTFSGHLGHVGLPGFTGPPINRATPHNHGSRSGSLQPTPTPAPDVPFNAPKGPKALLRGLPNTSILHLKARGLTDEAPRQNGQMYGGMHNPAMNNGVQSGGNSPADYSRRKDGDYNNHHQHDHDDRSKDRDGRDYTDRDYDRYDRDRSRSPGSRSRSRSRDRKDKDSHRSRRRRHRSESAGSDREDERADDDSRSRRHRSRKHRDDVEDVDSKAVPSKDEELVGEEQQRSRSITPDDSKRSSHHRSSRKDRDGEKRRSDRSDGKDRDRERDRDRDRDRKSHRSHRERDYDRRDRDRDRERDKDKDRDRKDRHRRSDRDREHRHRSSKRTSAEPEESAAKDDFNPPTGPGSRDLEIKGASSRSRHHEDESERRRSSVTAGPAAIDPHAAERAARDRERLLKETRRMASLGHKLVGGKRSRDDADENRRSSRRKGRGGEVLGVDDEEERMRRLEAEREAARFRDG